MKIIRKLISKLVDWAYDYDYVQPMTRDMQLSIKKERSPLVSSGNMNVSELEDDNALRFQVFNAAGGKVIKMNSYNPSTDRSKSSLYIITDKDDLGEELGQIITRESLSR